MDSSHYVTDLNPELAIQAYNKRKELGNISKAALMREALKQFMIKEEKEETKESEDL